MQQSVVGEGFFVFGRSSSSEVKAPDLPKPAPPPMAMPPAMPMAAPAQMTGGSTLASDLTVIGQRVLLVSQSRLLIDGEVRGDVNGREVIVGQSGRVTGTITAQSVEVRGQVAGALKASMITLHSTARVDGDIIKMTLVIAEGAHFDGNVRRARDNAEITPNLDPNQFGPA